MREIEERRRRQAPGPISSRAGSPKPLRRRPARRRGQAPAAPARAPSARRPSGHQEAPARAPGPAVRGKKPSWTRRSTPPRPHPAADGDVSFLGLAERLAQADPRDEPALQSRQARWEEHGFSEGDLGARHLAHGEIVVPVARMDAVNVNTVWTWNAIGKRKGAWALDRDARP